eukprot:CAMPEP_0202474190 /NCGR_PEP_ID=MMETSP1360-20130828/92249_1 /ASSEMBLY_ACC=CAM_ASM_000848 /TAXON_ID=515479 /ORGANISM="Licmophora paradoxa, Strain CCMP2313" /LENGTH=203 /DNA_ID=CAMNT_0049101295 /DNA_START=378 /DNA_END=989 /DNA_ORIENTATION=-
MTIHANHEICLIPQRSNYGRTIGCVNGRILEGATHVRPHTKRDDGDATIDRQVLKKYLIQDHRFLDAFVQLLASMVASARCLEDRIEGCQFLAIVTGPENTYFQRSFAVLMKGDHHIHHDHVSETTATLASPEEQPQQIPNAPVTQRFIQLMKSVSSPREGTLGERLAVLLVCEWTYLEWATRVRPHTKRDDGDDGSGFITFD